MKGGRVMTLLRMLRTMNRRLGLVVITGGFFSALLSASALAATALPSTPLRLFDGRTVQLQSFGGQVIVIRFAASW